MDLCVNVIIAAAGSGMRLGGSVPKQYSRILDKPLMFYAMEEFLSIKCIKRIVLVVDSPEKVQTLLQEFGCYDLGRIIIVKGEETRHRSIKAGLLELQKHFAEEMRVVVVHDGVRPLVERGLVFELVNAADKHGAAGAVRPLVSTVLHATHDGFLNQSLDRSTHVASETPQAFQNDILLQAYSKCSEEDLDHGTECLHLALKYCGVKAKLIPGSEDLWKVTHRKDLLLANASIKQKCNSVCIIREKKSGLITQLVDSISQVAAKVDHIVDTVNNRDESEISFCKSDKETYNTVIVFHEKELQQDKHLVNLSSLLNTQKQGLIIHVIENASTDGMQNTSLYSLQNSRRNMVHHCEKLHKGVVVVHCVTGDEVKQLANLLTTLLQADPLVFSGQTLFI